MTDMSELAFMQEDASDIEAIPLLPEGTYVATFISYQAGVTRSEKQSPYIRTRWHIDQPIAISDPDGTSYAQADKYLNDDWWWTSPKAKNITKRRLDAMGAPPGKLTERFEAVTGVTMQLTISHDDTGNEPRARIRNVQPITND